MKSIDAIYKFGNLYDRDTHKRILLEDGAEVSIVINPGQVLEEDPNLKPEELLPPGKKKAEVESFLIGENTARYWKLFDAGKLLYFYISAGIRKRQDIEPIRCVFRLQLMEDLYIYNKKDEPKYARFFDCHCIVDKCLDSSFVFFEPLYATSLNDAYTKTYELYFAMFGKSTANAFDRFFETTKFDSAIRHFTETIQKQPSDK